jgi:hypothetical protein
VAPLPPSLGRAAPNRAGLPAVRPYVAVWCDLPWLTALTRRRSMQLPKFNLAADVKPSVKDAFRFRTTLRRAVKTHVPHMFVDNMRRRQSGNDTRQEQNSRDDHSQIIDLAQPKEKVWNWIDR